jgi:alkanesulfonate monooxygenase SsuD/methylene tetrahydromethanopterin reductase-like flavin-dependent oxidoreductase (luciferase family)
MEFYFFHLMPWPYLPPDFDEKYDSAWVTLPNSLYDPVRGHEIYNRYLDELEYADVLGFDGICVNEHHQNAYGNMPSPNIVAATLARRTSRSKLAILGNALPVRDHPLRVAEEVAMLDVITGGRVIHGIVRGLGAEYHSNNVNPVYSRERFLEAHDLIIRAWTEPGPFRFEGKHYRLRYVNPWPRPLQKPHPPVWVPGTGSPETIVWAAQKRYPYLQVYSPAKTIKKAFDDYRAAASSHGYTASPMQLGWMTPVYVADTDTTAWKEAEEHALYLFHKLSKRPLEVYLPPGYLSLDPLVQQARIDKVKSRERSFEELVQDGFVILGSPATVTEKLRAYQQEMGFGIFCALLHFGTLPHDLTTRNLELFAKEVMPHFRSR